MSSTTATASLSADDIQNIAVLGALNVSPEQAAGFASSINNILGLMAQLSDIDTTGVEPLRNPFEVAQPLRADIANDRHEREAYQQIAPLTQDGLYLVPRVIE